MGRCQVESQTTNLNDGNITIIQRQLERLEDRTRDLATRADLEALRKDMVTRDLMESRLNLLQAQIIRLEQDRTEFMKEVDQRFSALTTAQTSRSERFWMRISPIIAAIALLIAIIQFLSHVHFV